MSLPSSSANCATERWQVSGAREAHAEGACIVLAKAGRARLLALEGSAVAARRAREACNQSKCLLEIG